MSVGPAADGLRVSDGAGMLGEPVRDVSVIIPTKDRPDLLGEAILSACQQTLAPREVIVVDDASDPPVQEEALRRQFGPTVRLLRSPVSRGLAFVRNWGVEQALSSHVIHLDDDDCLAPDTIAQCVALLQREPDLEWVMLGAQGFGGNAEHFNRTQPAAVQRVITLAGGQPLAPEVQVFDRQLFPALLKTVPIAFQRAMLSRRVWREVCQLRWEVYCLDPAIANLETAQQRIAGFLRDSEWALYAAIHCRKTAIINLPLYLQRCDGQGYSSRPGNLRLHSEQFVSIMEYLAMGARHVPAMLPWRSQIDTALAHAYFESSYRHCEADEFAPSLKMLLRAVKTQPQLRQLRLAGRITRSVLARR